MHKEPATGGKGWLGEERVRQGRPKLSRNERERGRAGKTDMEDREIQGRVGTGH